MKTKYFICPSGNFLLAKGHFIEWLIVEHGKCCVRYRQFDMELRQLIKIYNLRKLEMSEVVLIPELDAERELK